jgi:hypothetical protein
MMVRMMMIMMMRMLVMMMMTPKQMRAPQTRMFIVRSDPFAPSHFGGVIDDIFVIIVRGVFLHILMFI